jgi:hypothetical protein
MTLNDAIKVVYVVVPMLLTGCGLYSVFLIYKFKMANPENLIYEQVVGLYGLLAVLCFWLLQVVKI